MLTQAEREKISRVVKTLRKIRNPLLHYIADDLYTLVSPLSDLGISDEELSEIRAGNKIEAIKKHRRRTLDANEPNAGLKNSKDIIEAAIDRLRAAGEIS